MTSTFNSITSLTNDIQNYVVAPAAMFGLGGLAFDAEGESMAHLQADITDHYAEDNKAFQDHIAIKPKEITLKGYVGEVVYNTSGSPAAIVQQVVQKLTVLNSYLPVLNSSAQQIYSAASATSPANALSTFSLSDTANIYALVQNLLGAVGNEARQQNAYTYLKALMETGTIMSVQTPWEFMTNMAIKSVVALQREESQYITDFAVTLKQIRIAQTTSAAFSTSLPGQPSIPDNLSPQANQAALQAYRAANGLSTPPVDIQLQGAAALQAPDPVGNGSTNGLSLPTAALPGVQSQIGGAPDLLNNTGIQSVFSYGINP